MVGTIPIGCSIIVGQCMHIGLPRTILCPSSTWFVVLSHTLAFAGLNFTLSGAAEDMAHSSLRFGIGRFTTEAEIDFVIEKIVAVVQRLRDMR
jgi:hypothetical protein